MSLLPPTRVGMVTPSSNTCLEVVTNRLLAGRTDIGVHFSRLRVTNISVNEDSHGQFAVGPVLAAAELLADARVDVIVWNGTSGAWLGLDQDRELCAEIESATGVPATTSTLAIVDSLRHLEARRVGIAVPYTQDVAVRIASCLSVEGFDITNVATAGLTDNYAFARLDEARIRELVRAAAEGAHAVAVVCTNVAAAPLVPSLEAELDVSLCDSVAATLWAALRMLHVSSVIPGWGRLLSADAR